MKKLLCALVFMWVIVVQGSQRPTPSQPIDIPPRKSSTFKEKRRSFSPRSLKRSGTIRKRDSSEISNSGKALAGKYRQKGDLPSALAAIDGVPQSTSPDQSLKRNSQQSSPRPARPLSKSERPARRTASGPTPAVSKSSQH